MIGGLSTYLIRDKVPFANRIIFLFFIQFVLILEAIVCEMNHQLLLIFDILFRVILYSKSQIAWIEESNRWRTVVEQIAADVKLFVVEKKRFDVVLDESILFEIAILGTRVSISLQVSWT